MHWTNGADGGRTEDTATLTYVQNFAEIFDTVWNFEINTRNYLPPPDDTNNPPNDVNNRNPDGKYDVFVYNMSAYGVTVAEQSTAPSISHISVENDYTVFPGTQLGNMQVTAAHEFFHAIQFCYDLDDADWWYEATATYVEDEVYPNVNDNYQYLQSWFEFCDTRGLESTYGSHAYGDFIFAKRLSQDFGDDVIKEIWNEMQATNGLTAINNVLALEGSSIVSEFNKFTIANFFLEDMYDDGVDYRKAVGNSTFRGVWLEYQYKEASDKLPFTIDNTNVNDRAWMDKWATDYVTVNMSGAASTYTITFDGLDHTTEYDVSLITKVTGDIPRSKDFSLNTYKEGRMELAFNPAYTDVVLVIRNSGNTPTNYPSWKVLIAPKGSYEVTFYTNPAVGWAAITLDGNTYTNDETGHYNFGDYTATANLPSPNYIFEYWEYSGLPGSSVYAPNSTTNPTTVGVQGDGWLRAVFRKIAYTVTVRTSGLPYSSNSTHVYADDIDQDQPYLYDGNFRSFTFPIGETHTFTVDAYVADRWSPETRYYCSSNSTTANTDETIIFEYHRENLVAFGQQDCGGTPHVTVDNVTYSLPSSPWLDAEVEHTFEYESPVAGDAGVRYVISWTTYTSPYKFTYPTTVRGYYKAQFYVTIISGHGNPPNSTWVNDGGYLTVSVMSPAETVEGQTRWVCMGYKVDSGELKQGTSYSFWSVKAPHRIEFLWVQQFLLQLSTSVTGTSIMGSGWYDAHTFATISAATPYQPSTTHQFIFTLWVSAGTNTAQITDSKSSSTTVTMDNCYSIEAKWQEQWYITIISSHDALTPSQWVNASQGLSIYVTSPTDDDGEGTRYRCTGYRIDYEATQEGISYTFTNVQASHKIEFQWITQYRLVVSSAHGSPNPSGTNWYDSETSISANVTSPADDDGAGTRYKCMGWTGAGPLPPTGTSDSVYFTITAPLSIVWSWRPQYRITFNESGPEAGRSVTITVNGKPHLGTAVYTYSEWFDEDLSVTFSITDPIDSATLGKRYALINWKNSTGWVITSPQKISSPETFTAYHQTLCYLKVNTSPSDLSPLPSVSPSGPWYDASTTVTLEALGIGGYTFDYWSVDGASQGSDISSIAVSMHEPHTAIAYYKPPVLVWQPFLIALFVILGAVFIGAIFLVRRRRRKMP
ncbi:MAG: MXAN_6640 family putative metalloprotease [Candidatus Bathyarchaeia archaeon]